MRERSYAIRSFCVGGTFDRSAAIAAAGVNKGDRHPANARLVAGRPRAFRMSDLVWRVFVRYFGDLQPAPAEPDAPPAGGLVNG